MQVTAIDLASVRSGVCVRNDAGLVAHYTTDHDEPNREVSKMVGYMSAAYVLIEAVPPTMPNNTVLKNVYRKQGRLLAKLENAMFWYHEHVATQTKPLWEPPIEVVWIKPDSWQRHFDVFAKPDKKQAAVNRAVELGLEFGPKRLAKKTMEDLADSYLMAEYGLWSLATHFTLRTKWAFEISYPPGE